MYIYHFWPLSMHCQKTTTIRCFLEATYDLLVVLRKPWIYALCFDAHFSKFRAFWWFWTIFNRKMDILDLFWGPLTASSPKVTIYLPLALWTLSKPVKNPLKTPILTILDPFWGSWREVAARPRTSCLWAGGPAQSLSNPCPGPQILVILTTFPIEKGNFCHFAYQGSVKCHFDPILTPFWARLSLNFSLLPKCAYLFLGSCREAAARPVRAAFGLEDLLSASQTHARDPNFGYLTTFGPTVKPRFGPLLRS